MSIRRMTAADAAALATAYDDLMIGDYIDPLVFGRGATTGERVVMMVTLGGPFGGGLVCNAVDADGGSHVIFRSDDPRRADAEQIAEYGRRRMARSGP